MRPNTYMFDHIIYINTKGHGRADRRVRVPEPNCPFNINNEMKLRNFTRSLTCNSHLNMSFVLYIYFFTKGHGGASCFEPVTLMH